MDGTGLSVRRPTAQPPSGLQELKELAGDMDLIEIPPVRCRRADRAASPARGSWSPERVRSHDVIVRFSDMDVKP